MHLNIGPPPPYSPSPSYASLPSIPFTTLPANLTATTNLVNQAPSGAQTHSSIVHNPAEPIGLRVNTFRDAHDSASSIAGQVLRERNADDTRSPTSTQNSRPVHGYDERNAHRSQSPHSPVHPRLSVGRTPGSGAHNASPARPSQQPPNRSPGASVQGTQTLSSNSISLSNNNTLWTEDSILSGVFHRSASSVASSESVHNDSSKHRVAFDVLSRLTNVLLGSSSSSSSEYRLNRKLVSSFLQRDLSI